MNRKSVTDRAKVIELLVEGNSIRSTTRITGFSINTVLKILKDTGKACGDYQDRYLRGLQCKRIEIDEIHSFIGCRSKNVKPDANKPCGTFWVWTALCCDSKIIPTWHVGPRDSLSARIFIKDLASRMKNRIQLTSDGLTKYPEVIEANFGSNIDYAILQKQYDKPDDYNGPKRYIGSIKQRKIGNPDPDLVSTSYIERSNLTLRMNCKRFTRKTNAFSKTFENHCNALALHFFHYNYGRIHGTLRVTPAMEIGISSKVWSFKDIAELAYNSESYSDETPPAIEKFSHAKPWSAAKAKGETRGSRKS